jgi:hypothetical protein
VPEAQVEATAPFAKAALAILSASPEDAFSLPSKAALLEATEEIYSSAAAASSGHADNSNTKKKKKANKAKAAKAAKGKEESSPLKGLPPPIFKGFAKASLAPLAPLGFGSWGPAFLLRPLATAQLREIKRVDDLLVNE